MKKFSSYNFLFQNKEKNYIYNSLSNFLAELDDEAYHILLSAEKGLVIENLETYPELIAGKVFISEEEERDEIYNYKITTHIQRYQNRFMTLVIAPTYHCNFACSYCYETSRPPLYMDETTENNIVEFVKKIKTLNGLHVTWFGGEPLLNFEKIRSLTNKFLDLGLNYSADITTNGFLLDEEKISFLEELRINSIQITIDGIGAAHDARRPHVSGVSSFNKITENLDYFYTKDRATVINIRVNIDKTNEDNFYQLYTILHERYPKARISPSFVFTKDTGCQIASNCIIGKDEKFNFHYGLYKNYDTPLNIYPQLKSKECIARHAYSFVVGANGDLFKCFDHIGNTEYAIGNINNDSFNSALYNRYIVGADPLDDPKCIKCKIFPICSGGCPMLRLENEKLGEDKYDLCVLMKDSEEKFLSLHLEQKSKQSVN